MWRRFTLPLQQFSRKTAIIHRIQSRSQFIAYRIVMAIVTAMAMNNFLTWNNAVSQLSTNTNAPYASSKGQILKILAFTTKFSIFALAGLSGGFLWRLKNIQRWPVGLFPA
jgi:hypothetical protein